MEFCAPNTLVFGMAFISKKTYLEYEAKDRPDFYTSVLRDRIRLLALKKYKCYPFTMNRDQSADVCLSGRHYQGTISRRGVRGLIEYIREVYGDTFVFDNVFLEYYRMHGGYFEQVFGSFEDEVLPLLYESGIVDKHTRIYLPNRVSLWSNLNKYTVTKVCPKKYPLYRATTRVMKKHKGKNKILWGISNRANLHSFDRTSPFLMLQYRE